MARNPEGACTDSNMVSVSDELTTMETGTGALGEVMVARDGEAASAKLVGGLGVTTACPMAHVAESLDQVGCMAKDAVPMVTSWSDVHAHLSPFSNPAESTQPAPGRVSVRVSAYSCPATMEKPSKTPLLPALTLLVPHNEVPWAFVRSETYGRLV